LHNLPRAPNTRVHNDMIPTQVGQVDLVDGSVPAAFGLLATAKRRERLLGGQSVARGHARSAHSERRPKPNAQVTVDQPAAEPAIHEHAAGPGDVGLHPVDLAINGLILLGKAPHRGEAEAAATGLFPEDFPSG